VVDDDEPYEENDEEENAHKDIQVEFGIISSIPFLLRIFFILFYII